MLDRLTLWHRSLSISTRTAWSLAIGLTVVIATMTFMGFQEQRANAIDESLAQLDQYNGEIVADLGKRFDRIAQTQARAAEIFRAERAALDAADAESEFNALFPRRADGTRRSIDAMFEGGMTVLGITHGMAAFIPAGIERDPEAVRHLVAATHAVRALAEGSRFDLESLYFFTPANGIVIFAPGRPDRLSFYRSDAPASFDFQNREFATISTLAANPARATRCTGLQSLISLRDQEVWTTGCMTPVDRDGRHIGTFGTSMPLDHIVTPTTYARSASEDVVLISREGRLIHHPDYTRQHSAETGQYLDITRSPNPELRALWGLVAQHGKAGFRGHADALDAYVSMRAIPSVGWYALTVKPDRLVTARAMRTVPSAIWTAIAALAISVLVVSMLLRQLVGVPLQKLTRDAQRMTRELANEEIIALPDGHRGSNEVTRLASQFETMASAIRQSHALLEQRVAERTCALNEANEKLRALSEVDSLTGIANRRKILSELDARLAKMHPGSAMAALVIDVDNFKSINDRHGHVAGDEVLRALAQRVQTLLRHGDALGRMGGEEFMIILDRARPVVADAIAERIRAAIARQSFEVEGQPPLHVTVSIGVASWAPGDTAKSLYARADGALYQAKTAGRNCAVTSNHRVRQNRNAA
jgi:diguanylate cyclase (GGDEF)-like protein